jgi:UDPglucose 6-dehydrogenase
LGCKAELLGQVHARNEYQKQLLAQMVCERFGNDLKGKTFAVWGLAFKPNTDDIREAPAIKVIHLLLSAGAALKCYDPKACANAAAEFAGVSGVSFVHQPYDALENAEALIICTDWSEFRSPDFDRIRTLLKGRVIFDGRNLYDAKTMLRQRLEYHSIGRAPVIPDRPNGNGQGVFTLRRTGGSVGSPKQSDK